MTTEVFSTDEQKIQFRESAENEGKGPIHLIALRDGADEPNRLEPLGAFGLDRSSLPLLLEVIDALETDKMFDEANIITDNLADHQQISKFIRTVFKHAQDGFVQLRMFIDNTVRGDPDGKYGYPWRAVHVSDLDKLAEIATQVASIAARSPKKVNFCPPVATFIGTQKATEDDLCQGLAIMVELDEQPDQSREILEALLGAPTVVVKSGGKWQDQDRCHAYWRLSKPVSGNDPRLKQCRAWASDLVSSDPTGKPVNHPLRWPGSWHKKGEPRLCRISEINDAAEIDFEAAHTILKEAAAKAGLWVEQEEIRPHQKQPTYKADADWEMSKPGPQAILATYLSRTCNRRSALMGFASGIAMSALHAGYDLSIGELAGIVEDAHHTNPSTSKRTRKEFIAIAKDAQDWASQHVNRPAHIKRAEWEAYLQSEIERIERDIREADKEAADKTVSPEGVAAKYGDADNSAAGDDERDELPKPEQPFQAPQEPIDIFGSLTPKPVLTQAMLPTKIAGFAFDEAARMGVDPAMIAIPCLIVCAAAIDDGIRIQPKAEDTEWTESARLWGAAIGEPGVMKTPSLNKAVKPLQAVEAKWRIEDAKLSKAYETAMEDYNRKKLAFDKARRDGEDGEEPEEPERPPNRRCVVNEMSMEGLAERILTDNTRGVLVLYNELMGLIGGFDAYKNNGVKKDRAAALELFDGGPRNRDLVRDTVWVPNWSACILGGIQTDKLAKVAPSLGDDGLLQRFLLFEVCTAGIGEDRKPDMDAIGEYQWLIHQLAHLRADREAIVLSSEAQEYRKELQRITFALKEEKSLPTAFRGHANKMNDDSPKSAIQGPPKYVHDGSLTPDFYAINTMQPPYQPSANKPSEGGDAALADPAKPTTLPPQTEKTIGDLLSANGITWAWYAGAWQTALEGKNASPVPFFQYHHQPFNYFSAFAPGTSGRAEHLKDGGLDGVEFIKAIDSGALPQVAFYKPQGNLNEHPGYTAVLAGDQHIADVIAHLQNGPQWKHVLIVITYDEYGGFWDHVSPPKADCWGPGVRVPAMIISPFAKRGYVDHTQYDTTSILRFITHRYKLPILPGLAARDTALKANGSKPMGDLTRALSFSSR